MTSRPPRASDRSERSNVAVPTLSTTMSTPRPSVSSRTCSSNGLRRSAASGRAVVARPVELALASRDVTPDPARRRAPSRAAPRPPTCRRRRRRRARRRPARTVPARSMRSADDVDEPARGRLLPRQRRRLRAHVHRRHHDRLGVGSPAVLADDAEVATERHLDRAGTPGMRRTRSTDRSRPRRRSPRRRPPAPTASTTPAPSAPVMWGNDGGAGMPRATQRSRWLRAEACSRTRTSPAAGSGVGDLVEPIAGRSRCVVQEPGAHAPMVRSAGDAGQREGAAACPT